MQDLSHENQSGMAVAGRSAVPICVDLDGTLIRTDMLHEAVMQLLRINLLYVFLLPLWLSKGKVYLKEQIALRVQPNAAHLPYRPGLLSWLKQEKAEGRSLVLATASHHSYAQSVAQHLGLFDQVLATQGNTNLSGREKANKLVSLYGEKGFDYIGNGSADVPVWDRARQAITVGRERAAQLYSSEAHARHHSEDAPTKSRLRIWLKAIRVHQWLKNSLIFVPAILSSNIFELHMVGELLLAFIAFSLCASSVYLLNDLLDIETDRKHRTKCKRPIAAGQIGAFEAVNVAVAFLISAFVLSAFLPWQFSGVLTIYFIVTTAYSFILKRLLLIDVLTLASLFAIRVLAGSAAISAEISAWLLAFCMFFFLSLALSKRFVELTTQNGVKGRKDTGRGYHSEDLETLAQSGLASGFAAVVVLALFIDSPEIAENYTHPAVIWLVCPLVLYLVLRIWVLARRNHMHDDPVVFLMTDWRSQLIIGAGAILMLIAQMV